MLRSRFLVLLSAVMVAGCPATSMLHSQKTDLQAPPKREHFTTNEAYVEAIAAYQQYLETYKTDLVVSKKDRVPATCKAVIIAREFVLPSPPTIVSDDPSEQVNEIIDYVDTIRLAVKTHNEILKKQMDLFTKLCPSVDKYIVP